jgi:photosystem II stability/assembly factor-like uncharacterized protein
MSTLGGTLWLTAALLLCSAGQEALAQAAFKDPVDQPARIVPGETRRPLMAVAAAGERLVAVGSRGLVIVSTDQGRSWKQVKVPVQSDLLAVNFPTATIGFAVGHDGIVLRSDDAGATWIKQLDGRSAADAFRHHYKARSGEPAAQRALQQIDQNFKSGGSLPWLDVWFDDAERGYAVGSFGMLIATTDGGRTWTPWLDRIDHEQLNLNTVRGISGDVFIAGEHGRVHKLDRQQQRFIALPTGYTGSFFGLAGSADTLLAFGLRGVTYRSHDRGRSWEPVKMPSETTIAAGMFDAGSGAFVLVNAAGQLLVGDTSARAFKAIKAQRAMRLTGVLAVSKHQIVTTGLAGVALEPLPPLAN